MSSLVIGVSAPHHDTAACALVDGQLDAAAEEERFTRVKHQSGVPVRAFRWLLEHLGATPGDVDVLAVGEDPVARADRRAAFGAPGDGPETTEWRVRRALGVTCPVVFVPHHEAHAASAFFFSGMAEAAVLVVDGVGEWATTSIGEGAGDALRTVEEVRFPDSLGLLYATITAWLGFRVNHGEYKVMGLAGHGRPVHREVVEAMCPGEPDGRFRLDPSWFAFTAGERMFSDRLVDMLGPPRRHGEPLTGRHRDVAASVQAVLEDRVLGLAGRARSLTGQSRLCAAGGVMLNAVANGRLRREGPFEEVFVQPVAGDAGSALGAAAVASTRAGLGRPTDRLRSLRLGPSWSDTEMAAVVAPLPSRVVGPTTGVGEPTRPGGVVGSPTTGVGEPTRGLVEAVCDVLEADGVVGWFQGRMELGPRALGGRSILADPRHETSRTWINAAVKERERFRPLAPVVLAARAGEVLADPGPYPFMNETVAVTTEAIPAATHVDGSARPQTVDPADDPLLAALLTRWAERTGVPVLINTSFNHSSEPIVRTQGEALRTAVAIGLQAVVLGDRLVTDLPRDLAEPARAWGQRDRPTTANLYPL